MIRAETQTDLIRVNDGAQGPQGEAGAAGESIASITNYYLATAASSGVTRETSGWTTSIQTMDSTKQFLWNYEVVTGDQGSTITTTNPVIIGRYGLNGGTGKGISSITEYYLVTSVSSGVTTSTSGWTTAVQTTDATNKYLWNYEVIAYTSGNPYTSAPRIIGTYGDKGDKGDSPEITASKSGGATVITVDGTDVAVINDGAKGDKGDKGDTPSITAIKSGTTTTIKVDGATVATVNDGTDGTTPTITTSKTGTTTTIYANGTAIGTIVDGEDGSTPTITASKSGTTTTIKVDGTTIATVNDGEQGPQGEAGNDALISVSKSGNTATITAVSGDGTTTTATVSDGEDADYTIGGKNLIRFSNLLNDKVQVLDDTNTTHWNKYTDDTFIPSVGQWCRYAGSMAHSVHKEGDWYTQRFSFFKYSNVIIIDDDDIPIID